MYWRSLILVFSFGFRGAIFRFSLLFQTATTVDLTTWEAGRREIFASTRVLIIPPSTRYSQQHQRHIGAVVFEPRLGIRTTCVSSELSQYWFARVDTSIFVARIPFSNLLFVAQTCLQSSPSIHFNFYPELQNFPPGALRVGEFSLIELSVVGHLWSVPFDYQPRSSAS